MKTVVIYQDFVTLPVVFVVSEDWSRFDRLCIGAWYKEDSKQFLLVEELVELLYDEAGHIRFKVMQISDVPSYVWWDTESRFISIGNIS